MPWRKTSTMCFRHEFVTLAAQPDSNVRLLCRRFGISPKTGYKWIARARAAVDGDTLTAMLDQSRRPASSPKKSAEVTEQLVCQLREKHPAWGGRKLHARLLALEHLNVPAASTITGILRRNGLIDPIEAARHIAWQRFEYEQPNDLWQMDFVGHFAMARQRCHPLTIIDDHSRFCLAVKACANETGKTVQKHLIDTFRRYGLPKRILTDNGAPWGCDAEHRYTWLSAWVIRLGISVYHGRPMHPQTQGKDERFNRTVTVEALRHSLFDDLDHVQRQLDPWRDVYNLERPHEAIGMKTPATRYTPSPHAYPETLPPIEYSPGDTVRKVDCNGYFHFQAKRFKISQAFTGQPIGLRPTTIDGQMDVFYCREKIATIDLKSQTRV